MPFEVVPERERGQSIDVRPSAVLELPGALGPLRWGNLKMSTSLEVLEDQAPALREEMQAVWDDRDECLPDTSILAERLGALLTDEADTFLHGFERAVHMDGAGLELRSETPEVREATLARLERLRR